MTAQLRDTGVQAWLEADTAIRFDGPLHPTSTHARITFGVGAGALALFIDDPATAYKLAGVAVTLAKALERHQRATAERPSERAMREADEQEAEATS